MLRSFACVLLIISAASCSNEKPPLQFSVLEKKDISFGTKKRMVYRVVVNVEQKPSEKAMKETSAAIWADGNKRWDEFSVFIFLPGAEPPAGGVYGAAEFTPAGMSTFQVHEENLVGTKWRPL